MISRLPQLSRVAFAIALLPILPAWLHAQIGYPPDKSPYRDERLGQTITLSAGWISPIRDPAGVSPKSSALLGLRYDIGIGGPAVAFARYRAASTERSEIVPTRPAATRIDGTLPVTTQIADIGIDISLTGRKSFHHFLPSVGGGVGIATDLKNADAGGYRFGTKFAFSYNVGLRYVPGGRVSYRFDFTNYTWQYGYPDAYFIAAGDETAVLTDTRQRSSWRWNPTVMAGISMSLFK